MVQRGCGDQRGGSATNPGKASGVVGVTYARRITPALLRLRQRFDRAGAPVIHVNDNFAHWRGEFADLASWRASFNPRPQQLVLRIQRGNTLGQLMMR